MARTIKNSYYKYLTYEKLLEAHIKSRKGKGYRKEIILFNLKQEEYIMWLLEKLQNKTYKHGGYSTFYVTEPKLRKIEKSKYIDRIVHRWLVDNFLEPAFVPQFINTSYKRLKYDIKQGNMTSEEAQKYLAGHLGYIKIANTHNLENKLFYHKIY